MPTMPNDLLDMDYINTLPQLFDGDWPVYDFEVQTGLYRIDVCGLLEVRSIGRVIAFRDADGGRHYAGDLYNDPDSWEDRAQDKQP